MHSRSVCELVPRRSVSGTGPMVNALLILFFIKAYTI